jgi:hypothetical protein
MLQVSLGQCQTQLSIGQCQFQFSFFRFVSWITVTISIPSYCYVSLSVSKFRSLDQGGVSELSQAQVDR